MKEHPKHNFDEMRALWRRHLEQMSGGEPIDGLEMLNLMRMTVHIIDGCVSQSPQLADLSGPRMGILMRLLAEEELGNHQGIRPTRLSHYQNVKKNTVSALLNGLEEQGLIERTIDSEDKRGFNIRITPAGRERITTSMPERARSVNQLTAGLSAQEKQQMLRLLEKLRSSVVQSGHHTANCQSPESES